MEALFQTPSEPANASLESTWSSQPDLPAVDAELEVTAIVGPYSVTKKLGEGEFANVYACTRRGAGGGEGSGGAAGVEGEVLALKAINKAKVQRHSSILKSKRNIRRVNMEVLAMRRCSHASICRLHEVMQSNTFVYLVMEMGERDLFTFLDGYAEGCPDIIIKQVMRILALGLRHAHRAGIAHRDIKPENVLVVGEPHEWDEAGSERGIVKICDFGLCADIRDGKPLKDFVGSPGFFAPELMMREEYDGALADAWSMGAVMVEMFLGHRMFEQMWCPPYEHLHEVKDFSVAIVEAVVRAKLGTVASPPSEPVRNMFNLLLQVEPERRASIDTVCKASWFELLKLTEDGKFQLLRLTMDQGRNSDGTVSPTPPAPERRRRVGAFASLRATNGNASLSPAQPTALVSVELPSASSPDDAAAPPVVTPAKSPVKAADPKSPAKATPAAATAAAEEWI